MIVCRLLMVRLIMGQGRSTGRTIARHAAAAGTSVAADVVVNPGSVGRRRNARHIHLGLLGRVLKERTDGALIAGRRSQGRRCRARRRRRLVVEGGIMRVGGTANRAGTGAGAAAAGAIIGAGVVLYSTGYDGRTRRSGRRRRGRSILTVIQRIMLVGRTANRASTGRLSPAAGAVIGADVVLYGAGRQGRIAYARRSRIGRLRDRSRRVVIRTSEKEGSQNGQEKSSSDLHGLMLTIFLRKGGKSRPPPTSGMKG